MKKIFGNLFGLIGSVLVFILAFWGSGRLFLIDKEYGINFSEEVKYYDMMFDTIEFNFRIPLLIAVALSALAVVFFFFAIIVSLTKKTGKGLMGILGMVTLCIAAFAVMTAFLWRDKYIGVDLVLSPYPTGNFILVITWLVIGAKLSFDN